MRNLNEIEINNILQVLNTNGEIAWADSGVNIAMPTVIIEDQNPSVDLGNTVITRMFVNTRTGESKFIIIKAVTGE